MTFVYFIHEFGDSSVFKIGKTANHPAERLTQLQTGNHRELIIYRWLEVVNCSIVEEYLHTVFNDLRIRGEWFQVNTDMVDDACEQIVNHNTGVKISAVYPVWIDQDKLDVKISRKAAGKYRGKGDPVEAEKKKRAYMDRKLTERDLNGAV